MKQLKFLIITLILTIPSISRCQKLVLTKAYRSITDIDLNNWSPSTEFKKGDTVEFLGLSKADPTYYKIRSNGIVSYVYSSSLSEADDFFEQKRMKMDTLRQFVMNKSLGAIKKGDTVKIIEANLGSMGVKEIVISNGSVNQPTNTEQFKLRPTLDSIVNVMIQFRLNSEVLENEELRASREKRLRAKFGDIVYSRLQKGEIWIGMTRDMILEMKGYPKDINRTTTNSNVHEQWVYDKGRYYYFDNGKLTAWQD